jgi:hypothetical protein
MLSKQPRREEPVSVKPIRATIVENVEDWKKLWKMALTPPTAEQVHELDELVRDFFPSYPQK